MKNKFIILLFISHVCLNGSFKEIVKNVWTVINKKELAWFAAGGLFCIIDNVALKPRRETTAIEQAKKNVPTDSAHPLDLTILTLQYNSELVNKVGIETKEDFLKLYIDNLGSESGSPISFALKNELEFNLNYFSNKQYTMNNDNYKILPFMINSILYSLYYGSIYYLISKMIISGCNLNINSFLLFSIAEILTIGSKCGLIRFRKIANYGSFKNPDQKYIGLVMYPLIGSVLYGIGKMRS